MRVLGTARKNDFGSSSNAIAYGLLHKSKEVTSHLSSQNGVGKGAGANTSKTVAPSGLVLFRRIARWTGRQTSYDSAPRSITLVP